MQQDAPFDPSVAASTAGANPLGSTAAAQPALSVDESALFPGGEQDIQDANAIWQGGQEAADRDNPVGNFKTICEEAALERASSSGRLQIRYKLRILEGKYAGVVLRKYDGLGSAAQAKITQQQLQRLGIDTRKLTITTLPGVLLQLQGKEIAVTTKQNGQFFNVSFVKLLVPGAPGAASTGSGGLPPRPNMAAAASAPPSKPKL